MSTLMMARVSLYSFTLPVEGLRMVNRTVVPGSPRRYLTASCSDSLSVLRSSICMIRSPDMIPALKPGLSSMGETTVRKLSLAETTIPSPPKAPCVSF